MAVGFLLVFSAVLYFSWSIKVDIPAASYDVARGDNITIPCTFQSALPVVTTATVEWSRISKDGTKALILMYYWPDKDTDIADEYQNRAVFAGDMSRSIASVNISGISMADNGTIECNVNIKKDVSGKIQDITSLVVLVAPSTPVCSLEGKPEYGQDIRLLCKSAEGSPEPTYTWQSYSAENKMRNLPPKTTQDTGTLTLVNVSMDTSGFFVCTSANKIRSAMCNMTVAIYPPSMNIAFTAGMIALAVGGLIIIGIIAYCCCCRDKGQDEEYEMEYPDENVEEKLRTEHGETAHDDQPDEEHERSHPPMLPPNKPKGTVY
ncbi:glycoprotein A33 (transmembrane), paralog a [Polypterus senegalus]|uniref:glycoprotein A33 (transmembrane), paralog a n=1 Tax=Polypterus senegalus TaxID=55291 RepID=UPI00196560F0|nr:glycoprotein A33 (transmembrane), paralog a [Polypterus senegalus]